MHDPGWFCFFGVIAAVAAFVIVPISCATTNGYRFEDCAQPRQSIDGTVLQTCNFNPIDGFSTCTYRVVRTPLSCKCREWRMRVSCDAQWEKVKHECVCEDRDG